MTPEPTNIDPLSGYVYTDGTPIYIERGADGLDSTYGRDEKLLLYPSDTRIENPQLGKSATGEFFRPVYVPEESSERTDPMSLARQCSESSSNCTLARGAVVEFIFFGKSHRYFATDYPRYAPHFRDKLFLEARVLARSIQGDQAIAYEFLEGDASLGAWLSNGIRGAMDWWEKVRGTLAEPPRPDEYNGLTDRTFKTWRQLRGASIDDYAVIHASGIEFMRIRQEQGKLTKRVHDRIHGLIEAAENGLEGAKFVEESSFKILDLYAQIKAGKNEAELAAYRVGLMAIRVGARAAGDYLAESSNREILRNTGQEIRKDLPKILKDLFLSFSKRGFQNPQELTRYDQFALEILGLQVDFLFFVIDFGIFEQPKCPPGKASEKFMSKLADEMPGRVAGSVFAVLKAGLPADPYRSGSWNANDASAAARLKTYQAMETVICTLITSSIREYKQAAETAGKEKRPTSDVLLSDLGWIVVRVASDIAKAFFSKIVDEKLEGWMRQRYTADEAAGRKSFRYEGSGLPSVDEIKKEVRGLIVAFHIQMAPFDEPTPPASGTAIKQEKSLPKPAAAPTPQGDVGMNKYASAPVMQPPTPQPKPKEVAKELTKEDRKKVKTAQKLIDPQRGKRVVALPPAPKDQAHLKDIRAEFDIRDQVVQGNFRIRRASGVLGLPGTVVHVRDESAQGTLPGKNSNQHAGHLIATEFGAPGDQRNLAPQNAISNSEGTYRDLEQRWGKALKEGRKVWVDVTDHEDLSGNRHRRVVKWRVDDGEVMELIFTNPAPVPPARPDSTGGTLHGLGRTPEEADANLRAATAASARRTAAEAYAEWKGYAPLKEPDGVVGGKKVRVRTPYESLAHTVTIARLGDETSGKILLAAQADRDIDSALASLKKKWAYLKEKLPRSGSSEVSVEFALVYDEGQIPREHSNGLWVKDNKLMRGGKAEKIANKMIEIVEMVPQ